MYLHIVHGVSACICVAAGDDDGVDIESLKKKVSKRLPKKVGEIALKCLANLPFSLSLLRRRSASDSEKLIYPYKYH